MPRRIAGIKKQNLLSNAECVALALLDSALSLGCYQSMILHVTNQCGVNQQETLTTLQGLVAKQLIIDKPGKVQIRYELSDNGAALINQPDIYAFIAQLRRNNSELDELLTIHSRTTMCTLLMPNSLVDYLCRTLAQDENGFVEGLRGTIAQNN